MWYGAGNSLLLRSATLCPFPFFVFSSIFLKPLRCTIKFWIQSGHVNAETDGRPLSSDACYNWTWISTLKECEVCGWNICICNLLKKKDIKMNSANSCLVRSLIHCEREKRRSLHVPVAIACFTLFPLSLMAAKAGRERSSPMCSVAPVTMCTFKGPLHVLVLIHSSAGH